LFERQHAVEEASRQQERAEAAQREDAQRFAAERRVTYAKVVRLAGERVKAVREYD